MGGIGSGRPPSGKALGNVLGWRPLRAEDLASPRAPRVDAVQQIRARHHAIALMLAKGWSVEAIAAETFTTPVSIRQLEKDPSICELVAELQVAQELVDKPFIDERKRLIDRGSLLVMGHLVDRLEDEEQVARMSTRDLNATAGNLLDRAGYGKSSELIVRDGDFATKLAHARERSAKVIELRPPQVELRRPTVPGLAAPRAGEGVLASTPPRATFRRA